MPSDILPFDATEIAIVPAGASTNSVGVTPQPQNSRMGLIAVFSQPGAVYDGTYSLIIETAITAQGTAGTWHDTRDRIANVTGPGTYQVALAGVVLNKVRARVVNNATTPGRASIVLHWLGDKPVPLTT